jgi:hypothetical protein
MRLVFHYLSPNSGLFVPISPPVHLCFPGAATFLTVSAAYLVTPLLFSPSMLRVFPVKRASRIYELLWRSISHLSLSPPGAQAKGTGQWTMRIAFHGTIRLDFNIGAPNKKTHKLVYTTIKWPRSQFILTGKVNLDVSGIET